MRHREPLFDWSRLDGYSFQALCADLLTKEGFSVQHQGVGADGGADLLATQEVTLHAAHRKSYTWLVQVKYRVKPSSTVKPSELGNITNVLSRFQADGYFLITNGRVTNKAFAEIRSVSEGKPPTYLASVWDNRILESKLLLYRDLTMRYFRLPEERSVLVVDDEPAALEILTMVLSALAIRVHAAATPAEALKIASEQPIDVAVLDLVFPGVSDITGFASAGMPDRFAADSFEGFALAKILRQLNPSTRIVYYSGYMAHKEVRARRRAEDAVFLSKGSSASEDLLAAVQNGLDRVRCEAPQSEARVDPAALLGSVTHALANRLLPLSVWLEEHVPPPEKERVRSLLSDAFGTLHRATAQLAAIGVGREPTRLPSASADEILQRAVQSCRSAYSGATISINLPAEPILIQAVPVLLESSLFDLIVNGIQATSPDQGAVTVGLQRVERERPYARISVADNGRGIPRELIPALFLPGFSTKKGGGLGMGLFFAAKVAQYHRGWIEVESGARGGTEIRLYVRIAQGTKAEPPSPPGP